MMPMARTASRTALRMSARFVAGAMLLLATPARAEGEHWVPLYNKLVRMVMERTSPYFHFAHPNELRPLDPGETVTQANLNLLRGALLLAAADHYVPMIGETQTYHGAARIPKLVEYEQDERQNWVYDGSGNLVMRGPSIFDRAKAEADMNPAFAGHLFQNSNAFTMIPPGHGFEKPQFRNSFDSVTPLWEHFQELYYVIRQLGWTAGGCNWVSNGRSNATSAVGCGEAWTTVANAAANGFEGGYSWERQWTAPYAIFTGMYWFFPPNGECYAADASRCYSFLEHTQSPLSGPVQAIDYYAFTVAPACGGTWAAGNTAVLQDRWCLFSSADSASANSSAQSPTALGETAIPPRSACLSPSFENPQTSAGWMATDGCAVIKWEFTPWTDVEPKSLTETDFKPAPDPKSNGIVRTCATCRELTCRNSADAAAMPGQFPRLRIPVGFSSAAFGPVLAAEFGTGNTRLPHSGLAAGGDENGTFLCFNLDTRIVSSETYHEWKDGAYVGAHRYLGLLRPSGRIVTFHMQPGSTIGVPVGVDSRNGYLLRWYKGDSADLYDLSFPDEHMTHRYAAGAFHPQNALWKVITDDGTDIQSVEDTSYGHWPGLEWTLEHGDAGRLLTLNTPPYAATCTYNAAGLLAEVRHDLAATQTPAIKTSIGYLPSLALPYPSAIAKSISMANAWTPTDEITVDRGADGKWVFTQNGTLTESTYQIIEANGDKTLLIRRQEGQGPVRTRSVTSHAFPWGEEIVRRTDYDPTAPKPGDTPETLAYYDSVPPDAPGYGHLRQTIYPDGTWKRFAYDGAGRKSKEVRPFLNAAPEAADNACRVTQYSYTPVREDDDGSRLPERPRTITESVAGQETARTYAVYTGTSMQSIRCATAGAEWDAADNLVTRTESHTDGIWEGRRRKTANPDGTIALFAYETVGAGLRTTTWSGTPSPDGSSVIDGTKSVTVVDHAGRDILSESTDCASDLRLSRMEQSVFDDFGRPTRSEYLDGSSTTTVYGCCGPDTVTDRDGIQTQYLYDDLKRVSYEIRAGITTHYTYDVDGNVTSTVRIGSDNSQITLLTAAFDDRGRLLSSTDALSHTTTFAEAMPAAGGKTKTTTYPDGSSHVETYARDGSPLSVSGTAVHPVTYEYGADADGQWTKEIRIGANNAESEWVQSYTDMLGHPYKTVYSDNAVSRSYYNSMGQLVKQVDPDGVATLYAYNAKGEPEYTAIDMNANGQIDFAGNDRIVRTETRILAANGMPVRRATSTAWTTSGNGATLTAAVNDTSTDGLQNWSTSFGLTTHSVAVPDPATQTRTVTVTAPDGSRTVSVSRSGRPASVTRYDAKGVVLAQEVYSYDAHGHRKTVTDARGGTTTFAFNNGDQVVSVAMPDPDGSGPQTAQTARYGYDSRGRQVQVFRPDRGTVQMEYWPTGELRKTHGPMTYPVEYSYDPQGRMTSLTTWQNYTGNAGAAVTSWIYDDRRGFLVSKTYTGARSSPRYTFSAGGRLTQRISARGTSTFYGYSAAGDLAAISYSDGTPGVTFAFDRMGRRVTSTDAAGIETIAYAASGEPVSETRTGGPLDGVAVAWSYDSLRRRSGLAATHGGTSLGSTGYAYDDASRLAVVSSGDNTVAYAYQANSNLVGTITFNNGTANVLTTTKTNDHLQRLVSISSVPAGSSPVSYTYDYNAANQRIKATLADGSYWVYEYDDLGQVMSGRKYWPNDTKVGDMQFGYAFDDIGNRTSATTNGRHASYTANSLNQYTAATVPGAFEVLGIANAAAFVTVNRQPASRAGSYFVKTLTVDNSAAPVWQEVKVVGVRPNAGPDGKDVVTEATGHRFVAQTPEAFTYDADGNLTADGRWTYTWDGENRLSAMETAVSGVPRTRLEFVYDSQSRRVEKKVYGWSADHWSLITDRLFLYDGWNLIAEASLQDSQFTLDRAYAWGLDLSGSLQGAGGVGGLLSCSSPSSSAFMVYDGNGNVVATIDAATGAESARYEYDPFGNTLIQTDTATAGNPFRFSTKYTDAETGLLYYGLRYYSPNQGRWINRDPIEENGGIAMYGFCGNQPGNRIDLLGLYDPVHFYTAYYMAIKSGLGPDAAVRVAYFAEIPDIRWQYNPMSLGNIVLHFFVPSYRDYDRYLHSLNGMNAGELAALRDCLKKKLRDARASGDYDTMGILLHAYADTMSHVYEEEEMVSTNLPWSQESRYDQDMGPWQRDVPPPRFVPTGRTVEQAYGVIAGHTSALTFPDKAWTSPARYADYIRAMGALFEVGASDYSALSSFAENYRTRLSFSDYLPHFFSEDPQVGRMRGTVSVQLAGEPGDPSLLTGVLRQLYFSDPLLGTRLSGMDYDTTKMKALVNQIKCCAEKAK